MEKYCQNPLCDAEAVKQVKVSVKKPSDERRSLCACCEEVFIWGVQHGKKLSRRHKQWILAIADNQGDVTRIDLSEADSDHGKEDNHV